MIVQERTNENKFFGAVQFDKKHAEKSLAMYPGVKTTSLSALFSEAKHGLWTSLYLESAARDGNVYVLNGRIINDGDWLVADMDGKTTVYSDDQLKECFIGEDGVNL